MKKLYLFNPKILTFFPFLHMIEFNILTRKKGMKSLKRLWQPDFIGLSKGFERLAILCGPSANIEDTTEANLELPTGSSFVLGEKNRVAEVGESSSRYQSTTFTVTSLKGEVATINAGHWDRIPAGSSVNVGFALQEWEGSVGIFAPVGPGQRGQFLLNSLKGRGCGYALFEAEATARTLTVRPPDGGGASTLFCVKPHYRASHPVRTFLKRTNPELLIACGVKPADLHLVLPMFREEVGQWRAFTPHSELLKNRLHRPSLFTMLQHTDLLQVNAHEASLVLEDEVTPHNVERQLDKFASLGVTFPVITMGKSGAYLKKAGGRLIHQAIIPATQVDSCGAGDSHLSALCYTLFVRKVDLVSAMWAAANVAACVISKVGPWTGLPTIREMERIFWSSPSRPPRAIPPP